MINLLPTKCERGVNRVISLLFGHKSVGSSLGKRTIEIIKSNSLQYVSIVTIMNFCVQDQLHQFLIYSKPGESLVYFLPWKKKNHLLKKTESL